MVQLHPGSGCGTSWDGRLTFSLDYRQAILGFVEIDDRYFRTLKFWYTVEIVENFSDFAGTFQLGNIMEPLLI
jgi:hypothetical protein